MKDTIWFRNTIDELADSSDIGANDVKAVLVDAMLRFLRKKITKEMLLEVVQTVQTYRMDLLSEEVVRILQQLVWLLTYPEQLDPDNTQIQDLAEKVLKMIKI